MSENQNAGAALSAAAALQRKPLQLSSRDLFRDGTTVCIEHEGQQYWLRLTRANKLILTK